MSIYFYPNRSIETNSESVALGTVYTYGLLVVGPAYESDMNCPNRAVNKYRIHRINRVPPSHVYLPAQRDPRSMSDLIGPQLIDPLRCVRHLMST